MARTARQTRRPKPNQAYNRNPNGNGGFKRGNQLAKRANPFRHPFLSQQLIASLNDAYVDPETGDKTKLSRYAKMIEGLVDLACERDRWAIEFIFERLEGKVPIHLMAQHRMSVDAALPFLSDDELNVLEKAAKKVLTLDNAKVINLTPNGDSQ